MMYKNKGLSHFKELRKLMEYVKGIRGHIAGGCFKDIFEGKQPKDIDIFFNTKTDLDKGIEYYDNLTETKSNRWVKLYSTDNSVGYKDKKEDLLIDLIKKVYEDDDKDGMVRTIDRFDFTVTKAVMYKEYDTEDNSGDTLFEEDKKESKTEDGKTYSYRFSYHIDFFEDLTTKKLRYAEDGITKGDPVNMLNRVIRYVKKGFNPTLELKKELLQYIGGIDNDLLITMLDARLEDNEEEQYEDIEDED